MLKPVLAQRSLPRDGNDPKAVRRRSVTVNLAESTLCWLHARKKINDRQFAAGELLRADYVRAGLPQRVTQGWDMIPVSAKGSHGHLAERAILGQIDARRRFGDALRCSGKGLADILWRIVCADERIPEAERALGWPARAGKVVLSLALDRVADFYRVA